MTSAEITSKPLDLVGSVRPFADALRHPSTRGGSEAAVGRVRQKKVADGEVIAADRNGDLGQAPGVRLAGTK